MRSLRTSVQAVAVCVRDADGETLGDALIQIREAGIDPLEAIFATGVRRFDTSGEYKADGALSLEYEANPQNPIDEMKACLAAAKEAIAKSA